MSSSVTHSFYCMNCGKKGIDLLRPKGKLREKFHKKVLYCPWCKETVNHVECRTMEDVEIFKENFEKGYYKNEAKESMDFVRNSRVW